MIFVDGEQHKSREYPDVLIEIIIDILKEIQPNRWAWTRSRRMLRRQVKKLLAVLSALRDAAAEVTQSTEIGETKTTDLGVRLQGGIAKQYAKLSGTAGSSRSARRNFSETSTQTRQGGLPT